MKKHLRRAVGLTLALTLVFLSISQAGAQRAKRPSQRPSAQISAPTQYAVISTVNYDEGSGSIVAGPRTVTVVETSPTIAGGSTVVIHSPNVASLTINLTYDPDATFLAAGLTAGDITNMKAAMTFAATQFTSRYKDPVNVNFNVTAVAGVGTLGQSSTNLIGFTDYATFKAAMLADAKSTDDATANGALGSITVADPVGGGSSLIYPRAEAKALSLIPDDLANDGTFTFGGGFTYTYDSANRAVVGKIDFIGVAMHELSEMMGRIGSMGASFSGAPRYMPFDYFHYTGAATRGLNNGAGRSFSINNGTTLLKAFNNALALGGDLQDWASGANDTFNAFSSSGVLNALTPVDIQVMDVIGYDPQITTAAGVEISGRVLDRIGNGVRGARVTISDSRGHTLTVMTNGLGYYKFASVSSGDTYIASVAARGLVFGPRVITLNDSMGDLNFSPQ